MSLDSLRGARRSGPGAHQPAPAIFERRCFAGPGMEQTRAAPGSSLAPISAVKFFLASPAIRLVPTVAVMLARRRLDTFGNRRALGIAGLGLVQ